MVDVQVRDGDAIDGIQRTVALEWTDRATTQIEQDGVAVMFEHVIARYDPTRVASRPLVEPEIIWDVALMWRPGYLSRAARAWLDCVREIYPNHQNS